MAAELERCECLGDRKEQLDDLLCELLRRGDDVRTLMNPHTRHRCQFSRLRQRHSNAACRRCRAFLSFALRRHPFRWLEIEQRRLNEELEGLVSGMHTCQQALTHWRGKDTQQPQRGRRCQTKGCCRFVEVRADADADATETAEVTGTAAMATGLGGCDKDVHNGTSCGAYGVKTVLVNSHLLSLDGSEQQVDARYLLAVLGKRACPVRCQAGAIAGRVSRWKQLSKEAAARAIGQWMLERHAMIALKKERERLVRSSRAAAARAKKRQLQEAETKEQKSYNVWPRGRQGRDSRENDINTTDGGLVRLHASTASNVTGATARIRFAELMTELHRQSSVVMALMQQRKACPNLRARSRAQHCDDVHTTAVRNAWGASLSFRLRWSALCHLQLEYRQLDARLAACSMEVRKCKEARHTMRAKDAVKPRDARWHVVRGELFIQTDWCPRSEPLVEHAQTERMVQCSFLQRQLDTELDALRQWDSELRDRQKRFYKWLGIVTANSSDSAHRCSLNETAREKVLKSFATAAINSWLWMLYCRGRLQSAVKIVSCSAQAALQRVYARGDFLERERRNIVVRAQSAYRASAARRRVAIGRLQIQRQERAYRRRLQVWRLSELLFGVLRLWQARRHKTVDEERLHKRKLAPLAQNVQGRQTRRNAVSAFDLEQVRFNDVSAAIKAQNLHLLVHLIKLHCIDILKSEARDREHERCARERLALVRSTPISRAWYAPLSALPRAAALNVQMAWRARISWMRLLRVLGAHRLNRAEEQRHNRDAEAKIMQKLLRQYTCPVPSCGHKHFATEEEVKQHKQWHAEEEHRELAERERDLRFDTNLQHRMFSSRGGWRPIGNALQQHAAAVTPMALSPEGEDKQLSVLKPLIDRRPVSQRFVAGVDSALRAAPGLQAPLQNDNGIAIRNVTERGCTPASVLQAPPPSRSLVPIAGSETQSMVVPPPSRTQQLVQQPRRRYEVQQRRQQKHEHVKEQKQESQQHIPRLQQRLPPQCLSEKGLYLRQAQELSAEYRQWAAVRDAAGSAAYIVRELEKQTGGTVSTSTERSKKVRFTPQLQPQPQMGPHPRPGKRTLRAVDIRANEAANPVLRLVWPQAHRCFAGGKLELDVQAQARAQAHVQAQVQSPAQKLGSAQVPPLLVTLEHNCALTFGRGHRADVPCASAKVKSANTHVVSKAHATLFASVDLLGTWSVRVQDLGSSNGTFVFGRGHAERVQCTPSGDAGVRFQQKQRTCKRLHKGDSAQLSEGDYFALGQGGGRIVYELQMPRK